MTLASVLFVCGRNRLSLIDSFVGRSLSLEVRSSVLLSAHHSRQGHVLLPSTRLFLPVILPDDDAAGGLSAVEPPAEPAFGADGTPRQAARSRDGVSRGGLLDVEHDWREAAELLEGGHTDDEKGLKGSGYSNS